MDYKENYEKDYSSELRLKKMYIEKASFERKESVNNRLDIKINHNVNKIDNELYEIKIILDIMNKDASININVVMVGIFESNDEKLIQSNAISIMFPYLRSYISTLTTQPDLVPIVLQPVNVLSLLSKQ